MIKNQENGEKPHFGPDSTVGPNSGCNFFKKRKKNLVSSLTRYHGQLSYLEKCIHPILR